MFGYLLFFLVLQSVNLLPFNEDDKLLSLILEEHDSNGRYTVVKPETTIWGLDYPFTSTDSLIVNGYNCEPLVRQLIEKNRQSVRLTIESNPSNGYIIDKDDRFSKYFSENGGGWETLYKENPNVNSITSVSLPVYDKETNLVLVYKSNVQHYLAGAGYLIIYSFNKGDGKLQELMNRMIWIS